MNNWMLVNPKASLTNHDCFRENFLVIILCCLFQCVILSLSGIYTKNHWLLLIRLNTWTATILSKWPAFSMFPLNIGPQHYPLSSHNMTCYSFTSGPHFHPLNIIYPVFLTYRAMILYNSCFQRYGFLWINLSESASWIITCISFLKSTSWIGAHHVPSFPIRRGGPFLLCLIEISLSAYERVNLAPPWCVWFLLS